MAATGDTRRHFRDQLDTLEAQALGGIDMVVEQLDRALEAAAHQDVELASFVIADDDRLDGRYLEVNQGILSLLALQAPVAGDLRAIVSAIQIVADIDRMGALALHVAKIARRRHPQHALPEEVNGYFAEMGRVAVELGQSTQEALLTQDPEKAAQIREEDDAMDDLHRHLFTVLMDREWKHGVTAAVDVTLLSRFYERFADHAVEIARRVIFQATGSLPEEEEIPTPR
jgi:phosphate transport system protein